MTPEELEAERLRLQAEASTNPMMQPTNLIGQQNPQDSPDWKGTDSPQPKPNGLGDRVERIA